MKDRQFTWLKIASRANIQSSQAQLRGGQFGDGRSGAII